MVASMSDQPSLLPPNASALERKLEQATLRLGTLPVPLRELWNPDTCPAHLLPWLAWTVLPYIPMLSRSPWFVGSRL